MGHRRKLSIIRSLKTATKQFLVAQFGYGQLRSALRAESVDANGDPIPWFTYPAIEFLKQFDLSGKRIFEWGSGNSTLFWARNAEFVTAVEDNPEWYESVRERLPANAALHFAKEQQEYVSRIESDEKYDIIVIDGNHRWECAQVALNYLVPDGMVILDNSWGLPGTCAHLATAGDLIQVDFIGFTPVTGGINATSVFLSRSFAFPQRAGLRPWISAGGPKRPEWIKEESWR